MIGGVLLFLLLLVPAVLWQYQRFGRLSPARLLGAAALAVYGVALVAYTLLPLPSGDLAAWCAAHGFDGANLNPGLLFTDIAGVVAERGVFGTLRSVTFLQGAFNVLLFVPWGMLARRYLGWGFWASTASGLAASLLIETTQYTGIFGLIGCSYRYADVDDLLTNTLGAAIGALAAPLVLRWMPQSRALAATRGTPRPVTVWRRWLGMATDAFAFVALGFVLQLVWRLGYYVLTGETVGAPRWVDVLTGLVVPFLVVFVVPLATASGASWGQRAVWLRPVLAPVSDGGGPGAAPGAGRRLARWLGGGGLWGLLSVAAGLLTGVASDRVDLATNVLAGLCVLLALTTKGRRGLSGLVSGTTLVDARSR